MDRPAGGNNTFDAYAPAQIARLVESVGVRKAALSALQTATLGVLAGAFIAFGAMFFTVVVTDSALGLGRRGFWAGWPSPSASSWSSSAGPSCSPATT
jgi:hypothetical protein